MQESEIRTLAALFFWNVEQFHHETLLTWKQGERTVQYSTSGFKAAVLKLAKWLRESGLEPGDRVALYADNRPEWHVVDFAAHVAKLLLVPVYSTLNAGQMQYVLEHSGAKALFCGEEQHERVDSVRSSLPALEHVIAFDARGGVANLEALLKTLPEVTAEEIAAFRRDALAGDPESVATIVYTSGTTGLPKGVMLSDRNIVFDFSNSVKRLPERPHAQALSVLPLSHVFERILCYGYFLRGVRIAYGDPHTLRELLNLYRPTIMGAVPRILEKMREAIEGTVAKMPAHRRAISRFLLSVGYARLDGQAGWKNSLYPVAQALMFRKVRRQLGDVEFFIVGGAWLNPQLERYFRALSFTVLQGYGLTETSPVITVNGAGRERSGTAGQPIDGVEVRISEEGEITTRGPQVMVGYFKDPEATAAAIRNGWFFTGDLGSLDADGYLTITGRRKEMLVLSNGKNIYYAPMEQALRQSALVEQVFVVGEGRNYTAAIVVPNMSSLLRVARERGILFSTEDELLLSAPVLEMYREAIDEKQSAFSRFEQVKRFCFLKEEALLDEELVTPTLKVRRNVLDRKYSQFIDRLYKQEKPFLIPAMVKTINA